MAHHLDQAHLDALLTGRLSVDEEAKLTEHLAHGECELCQRWLESLPVDIEQRILDILLSAQNASAGSAQDRQNILEAIAPKKQHRFWWWLIPASAAAAFLAFVWLVAPRVETDSANGQRDKGQAARPAPTLSLSFAVVSPIDAGGSAAPAIQRGASGASVPSDRSLVFQIQSSGPCRFSLWRLDEAENSEQLIPSEASGPIVLEAGANTPNIRGRVAGIPLQGLSGKQRFVAICSLDDLPPFADLASLAKDIARGKQLEASKQTLSYDMVWIWVNNQGD